jgi:hypothetical protein
MAPAVSSSSSSSSSGGIGFAGLLTIAFIVLKLIHKIAWSWWWVLSPLWIGAAAVGLIMVALFLVALVMTGSGKRRKARR